MPGCLPAWKWAGGKRQLLPHLLPLVPATVHSGRTKYFEPFVGAGALFFAVQPRLAVINDTNSDLMAAYGALRRDNLERLIHRLQTYESYHRARGEAFYYQTRSAQPKDMIERAARFIYLNKTCFNGLYRVNKSGMFNVPFGKYENPTICDVDRLRACSKALHGNVLLTSIDFETIAGNAKKGDFVYFDPPYVPLTATSNFTAYGKDGFSDDDQIRLRDLALKLKNRGVKVVLSNSSADRVLELYDRFDNFSITFVDACRAINSDAKKRGQIKEVIIT